MGGNAGPGAGVQPLVLGANTVAGVNRLRNRAGGIRTQAGQARRNFDRRQRVQGRPVPRRRGGNRISTLNALRRG